MKKKQLKHESYQDNESIKRYLHQIIDGLEEGKISISSGEESITLEPHGLMEFVFNSSQSKNKQQLSLKICWTPKGLSPITEYDELIIENNNSPIKLDSKHS